MFVSTRGDLRHHVRLAIFSAREVIGGFGQMAGEASSVWVEGDPGAERGWGGFEVDAVFTEIVAAAVERVA